MTDHMANRPPPPCYQESSVDSPLTGSVGRPTVTNMDTEREPALGQLLLRFLYQRRDYVCLVTQLVLLVISLTTLAMVATDQTFHHGSDPSFPANLTQREVIRAIKKAVKSVFVGPGNDTTILTAMAQDLMGKVLHLQHLQQDLQTEQYLASPEETGG